MQKFKDKKVVITGGNRGIGHAIALAFAEQGANIVITYNVNKNAADAVVDEIKKLGVKAKAIQINLLNDDDISRLVEESYEFLGDIDILVNNAAILTRKDFIELSREEITTVFKVNILAPFFLMQEVAKQMVKQQENFLKQNIVPRDYNIINITSISKELITIGLAHYEVSKAALSQLSKSAAVELARYHIRVNDIAPGTVPTEINQDQWESNSSIWKNRMTEIPLSRAGMPTEIADAVLFAAGNAYMTGTTITVDGGRMLNWFGS